MANKLYINSILIDDLIELLSSNDTRLSNIVNNYYNVNFVAPATGYVYSETITYPFKVDGTDTIFPLRGTRPTFKLRYEFSNNAENTGSDNANRNNANVMRYLIKKNDKSVWVAEGSDLGPDYDSDFTGTQIATPEEDLKKIFLILQGAGGGGGGNNGTMSGAGGGAGGYLVAVVNLEHEASTYYKKNSIPITVGAGGTGGYHTKVVGGTIIPTGFGGDTGIPWNTDGQHLTAWGGDGGSSAQGANSGTRGNGGSYAVGVSWATLIFGINGDSGMSGGLNDGNTQYHTNIFNATTTGRQTPDVTDYEFNTPERTVQSLNYGGNGGSCPLGTGGIGSNEDSTGTSPNAQGPGAGGGGSGNHVSKYSHGGKGGNGYFAVYY